MFPSSEFLIEINDGEDLFILRMDLITDLSLVYDKVNEYLLSEDIKFDFFNVIDITNVREVRI